MFGFVKKGLKIFGISTAAISVPLIALFFLNPPLFMAISSMLANILGPLATIFGTIGNAALTMLNRGLVAYLKLPLRYQIAIAVSATFIFGTAAYRSAQGISRSFNPQNAAVIDDNGLWITWADEPGIPSPRSSLKN